MLKKKILSFTQYLFTKSIKRALKEQGLSSIHDRLIKIVPDISDQYSRVKLGTEYLITKVRAMHAFQVSLIKEAVVLLEAQGKRENIFIVDIGDSSGTHLKYIEALFNKQNIRSLSLNLDEQAVNKIREKGLKALCMRAEDLHKKADIKADIFLVFEMLEHMFDPANFLRDLQAKADCKLLVLTVPFLRGSRVGLHHLRRADKTEMNAENTHIFEFSSSDWQLLFKFSGWKPVFEKTYLQYPKGNLLGITRPLWKKLDFEGFYGAILTKDATWSNLYKDW